MRRLVVLIFSDIKEKYEVIRRIFGTRRDGREFCIKARNK
jgi:hypothetical protein